MSRKHAVFVCRTLELSESTDICEMVRESSECSRIPLVWLPWDGYVLDYQVVDSS